MALTSLLDAALDRSVFFGYTRIGSKLRSRWWAADPAPESLHGKRVLVTGATSGIGEAMAQSFVELGATVHLLGRNPEKVQRAARDLRLAFPNAEIVEETCDVSDLDAVRAWAGDFCGRVSALHGIVHNAGTMLQDRTESAQGHEMSLAAHVLGPHLITELLQGPLMASGGSSVVFMSSGGMYSTRLREDDIEYRTGTYKGVQGYARTKRMQVVLADAWSTRLAASDVRVESMHPGWVATSGIAESLPTFGKVLGPLLRDVADGADTAVWLVATRPPSQPQHFWHDRAQRPTTYGWQRDQDPNKQRLFLDYVSSATGTPSSW